MLIIAFSDRSLGGDVSSDGDFLIFEGNRYSRKGFLFKSFAMSAVVGSLFFFKCEGSSPLSSLPDILQRILLSGQLLLGFH